MTSLGSLVDTPLGPLPVWSLAAIGVTAALLVAIAYRFRRRVPRPQYTVLKNGKRVRYANWLETQVLFTEIFEDDSYEKNGIVIKPGDTVVDVGGNIGFFTLWVMDKIGASGHVYAFEPIPSTFDVLRENASLHGKNNFTVFNFGCGKTAAEVEFEHHKNLTIWSTSDSTFAEARRQRVVADMVRATKMSGSFLGTWVPASVWAFLFRTFLSYMTQSEKVTCQIRTLSSVIEGSNIAHIHLLKVDVEGAEMDVLRGIQESHWARIDQVVLEAENFAMVDEIRTFLGSRGFTVESVASERAKAPGIESEVSMVYCRRNGATASVAAAPAASPAPAAPVEAHAEGSDAEGPGPTARRRPKRRE